MRTMTRQTVEPPVEQGFTILETMCAVVIVLVSLLGLASVATYAINNNNGGRSRELAMALGQQRLERLRNTPFNSLTGGCSSENDVTSDGMRFVVETSVCTGQESTSCHSAGGHDSQASPTQMVITLRVTPQGTAAQWAGRTDANDTRHSVVLMTYRAAVRPGVN